MSRKPRRWRAAAVQMTSTEDREKNLAVAHRLTRRAAEEGAALVALPENFSYLRLAPKNRYADDLDGELVDRLREWAKTLRIHLLAGSVPERIPGSRRVHNTSLLLSPRGDILAVYRKLHLFDIHLRGRAVFEESKMVAAGDEAVVADTPLGRLGLSICYDLRFPELYRRLVMAGAEVLLVPSAFTAYTGKFHWLPLLQARAIENQCWVLAPAQTGPHGGGRVSHGHSVLVDPWGTVVAMRPRGAGIVTGTIDLDQLEKVRAGLPCLEHARTDLLGRRAASRRRASAGA